MPVSLSETIGRSFWTGEDIRSERPESGARRFFDQGCELGHLILGLRIRRLGVRVPSGAHHLSRPWPAETQATVRLRSVHCGPAGLVGSGGTSGSSRSALPSASGASYSCQSRLDTVRYFCPRARACRCRPYRWRAFTWQRLTWPGLGLAVREGAPRHSTRPASSTCRSGCKIRTRGWCTRSRPVGGSTSRSAAPSRWPRVPARRPGRRQLIAVDTRFGGQVRLSSESRFTSTCRRTSGATPWYVGSWPVARPARTRCGGPAARRAWPVTSSPVRPVPGMVVPYLWAEAPT